MERRRVTFLFHRGQAVRWADYPYVSYYVCQRRWTERDVMPPIVEYGLVMYQGRGEMWWAVEADLEPWEAP